ncbi:MAG: PAS domain-containing protein [Planctomycetota bacterium]|nr:MAG: PAS domain-containing protein [Planctomycetota bacterium]
MADMSQSERDELDFGIVEVDERGIIRSYNRYESELAGVAPEAAMGRNFFTQVAPCTNNRLFYGRFKRGLADGQLDAQIPYTFTYKMRPTNVVVRMYLDTQHATTFVFVKRR